MIRPIGLGGCILYCLSVGGCGGSGRSSARVTRDNSKPPPYFSATIEWNIAKDIEDGKIEFRKRDKCRDGWCEITFGIPKNIMETINEFTSSTVIFSPQRVEYTSDPRPLLRNTNNKWFISETMSMDAYCIETRIFIEYQDEKILGKDWIKDLPRITLDGSVQFKSRKTFASRPAYPRIIWYIRRCTRSHAGVDDRQWGTIEYRNENFVAQD